MPCWRENAHSGLRAKPHGSKNLAKVSKQQSKRLQKEMSVIGIGAEPPVPHCRGKGVMAKMEQHPQSKVEGK